MPIELNARTQNNHTTGPACVICHRSFAQRRRTGAAFASPLVILPLSSSLPRCPWHWSQELHARQLFTHGTGWRTMCAPHCLTQQLFRTRLPRCLGCRQIGGPSIKHVDILHIYVSTHLHGRHMPFRMQMERVSQLRRHCRKAIIPRGGSTTWLSMHRSRTGSGRSCGAPQ